jgi:hypothetical protein
MFDIRLALRVMRRQPGFTLVSVTLIALAIAATTSIFSVVNSVVLEPLPSVKMDGLVRVFEYDARRARTMPVLSNSTYYAWHDTPEGVMPRGFQFPDRLARVWLAARPPTVIESVSTGGFGRSVALRFSFHNGVARSATAAWSARLHRTAIWQRMAVLARNGKGAPSTGWPAGTRGRWPSAWRSSVTGVRRPLIITGQVAIAALLLVCLA